MFQHHNRIGPLAAAALMLLSWTVPPVFAENSSGEQSKGPLKNLVFHGYLNQALGATDGVKYRGVTDDGTADLRTAAFQVRYEATKQDELVLQLAHESVGTSPTNEFRDDLELDWLFYKREFVNGLEVKVGRVPLPIGIYNEVKDAGVTLPFYRPSGNYYGEGTWTSDTVDGAVLSFSLAEAAPWGLDVNLYGGSWKRIETDGGTLSFGEADIDNAWGAFLWLRTPVSGLRFGFGYNRFDVTGGVFLAPGVEDQEETSAFSIDGDFDRFSARFEISRREFTGGYWQPYYFELVYRLNEHWRVMALRDVGNLRFEIPFFATFDDSIEELWAVGVSYVFKPSLVVKLEHHFADTYGQVEDRQINIFFDQPVDVNLTLLSVSMAF